MTLTDLMPWALDKLDEILAEIRTATRSLNYTAIDVLLERLKTEFQSIVDQVVDIATRRAAKNCRLKRAEPSRKYFNNYTTRIQTIVHAVIVHEFLKVDRIKRANGQSPISPQSFQIALGETMNQLARQYICEVEMPPSFHTLDLLIRFVRDFALAGQLP